MKKVLIVEDDFILREELKKVLQSSYEVLLLTDFSNVLEDILAYKADMVLLDIKLPNLNGEQILRKLRTLSNVPVIMLTSSPLESDEVLSLSYGADDYITKPYNPTILLLHMEAIFKRLEGNFATLSYEDVVLYFDKCVLVKNGMEYYLSKNEMLIFKYFILHRGVIVKREDLMRYLWDSEEFIDDNTLSVNISRLRSKLLDVGLRDVIVTRKGIGYFLK